MLRVHRSNGMMDAEMDSMFGRYRILGKLGEGGMACVYMAEDPALHRAVALKIMHGQMAADPEWIRRFRQEATTVARLGHHQIVQIHDSGTQNGSEFLVMEFQDRGSFGKILDGHGGSIAPQLAACIVLQAAEGLAAAHEAGVVHRDVKPDNILLSRQGVAKVADFGIARLQNDIQRTQPGVAMGSPQYMAPEQIEGGEPTGKTDVFALGSVLYKSIAGAHPFESESVPSTMWRIVSEDPKDLREAFPDCPRALSDLARTMLQKKPEKRPSMEDVAHELRAWLSQQGILQPAEHLRRCLGFPQASRLSGAGTTTVARAKSKTGIVMRIKRAFRALVSGD